MKKFVLSFCIILLTNLLIAQKVEIDKKTIKFPKTKEGILLKHKYKITNVGNAPLLLDKYEVACSCTKATFPKTPILPNQSVDVFVTFDTNHKIGFQDRIISLYSNAENSPNKLRFKVMIDNK